MGNFLGIYGSLAALTERHPVASEGDTAIIGGVVYYWNQYEYHWQDYPVPTDEQESGGSDSGSHQAPAHHATHKVGEYDTLLELWEDYPDGGHDGDYAVVSGNEYYWDDDLKLWIDIPVEDTGREVTKFDGDVTIGNDLYVGGRIHCMWVFSPYDRLFQRLYMRFSGIEDYVDELDDSVTALQTRLAGDENTIQQILTRIGDMSTVSCYNSISSLGGGVYLFSGSNVPDVTIAAGGGGGTPGDLSNYFTKDEIRRMLSYKVDVSFFELLFNAENSSGTKIDTNADTAASSISRIKALKDFYSVGGVSALGYSSGGSGGGGGDLGELLTALKTLGMPTSGTAYYLYYDGSGFSWSTGSPGGGGGIQSVGLIMPEGFSVAPASLSGSGGTFTVEFGIGYSLLEAADKNRWNAFCNNNFAQASDLTALSNTVAGLDTRVDGVEVRLDAIEANNYVTEAFFNRLFEAYNGNNKIDVNGEGTVTKIKALADFFSEGGISALGYTSGGSGGSVLTEPLLSINSAFSGNPTSQQNGYTIVWNGSQWVYGKAGSDVDLSGLFTIQSGYLTGVSLNGNPIPIKADMLDDLDSSAIALGTDGVANSATKLNVTRTLWGQQFDGTQNVSGDLSDVGNINMDGYLMMNVGGANSLELLHIHKTEGVGDHIAFGYSTSAKAQLPIRFFGREFLFNYTTNTITGDNYSTAEAMKIGYRQISEVLEEPAVYVRKHLMVGDGAGNYFPVTYDSTHNALCFSGDIYATGGISALGFSSTPNGGALINGTLEVAGQATLRGGLDSIGNVSVHGNINAEGDVAVGSKIKMPNAASENDAYIGVNTTSGNLEISGGDGGVDIDGTTVAINGATIDNNGCIETQSVTITNSVELNDTDLLRVKYNGTWYKLNMARAIDLGLFVTE